MFIFTREAKREKKMNMRVINQIFFMKNMLFISPRSVNDLRRVWVTTI